MSHTVASYIDRLPQEVWAIVIEHLAGRRKHGDQIYLWNICRLVSRQFKYAVEAFFLHRFLHKTLIRMEAIICTEYTSHWDFRVAKCFETRFDQMSIDGNRAIFKVKNEGTITSFKGLLSDKTRRDWQYCFIQLCTHTNYANIRLQLNPEEGIELDWRELFGANLATRRLCTRPGCGWIHVNKSDVKDWSVFKDQQTKDKKTGKEEAEKVGGVEDAILFSLREAKKARESRIHLHYTSACRN